jgi:hypothetical protein|tara:strand:- start:225 stop:422 length:198 start_codon:yes stop_codon:yes gene_type:complete
MTFPQIMLSLSKMYNSYDATCWLNRERRSWEGASAAELLKDGKTQKVTKALKEDPRYKKVYGKGN